MRKAPEKAPPALGPGRFRPLFEWRAAHRKAWSAPMEIVRRRARKAQEAGVSYERYTLELLERGRHLQKPEK